MIQLSVVIITYNEEINIKRCLDSVLEIADEIIVVDSYSTDSTEQICRNYQMLKFFQRKFDGYSQQKNWANSQASFAYVLSIDADEVIGDVLLCEIKKVKQNWTADCYSFNRLTNYCGKWIRHCGWYPDTKKRMWKVEMGKWVGDYIHEDLEMQKTSTVLHLKGDLLHYSYYSIKQHVIQANNFTENGALMLFSKGKKASLFSIIIKPFWKFIRDYFIKGGFLDGYYGFVICIISSQATFLKYIKLKELYKDNSLDKQ